MPADSVDPSAADATATPSAEHIASLLQRVAALTAEESSLRERLDRLSLRIGTVSTRVNDNAVRQMGGSQAIAPSGSVRTWTDAQRATSPASAVAHTDQPKRSSHPSLPSSTMSSTNTLPPSSAVPSEHSSALVRASTQPPSASESFFLHEGSADTLRRAVAVATPSEAPSEASADASESLQRVRQQLMEALATRGRLLNLRIEEARALRVELSALVDLLRAQVGLARVVGSVYRSESSLNALTSLLASQATPEDVYAVLQQLEDVPVGASEAQIDTHTEIVETLVQAELCNSSSADDLTVGSNECPVCLDRLHNGQQLRTMLSCRHVLHDVCLRRWLTERKSCPLCRAPLIREAAEDHAPDDSGQSSAECT